MIEPLSVTVLVVDDDPIVRDIYTLALQRAGFKVLVAADGISALQAVSDARPDFVFLDIKMPRMDGIEVLRQLQAAEATRAIPVVMMSNFDDPGFVKESSRLGAKQYCVKTSVSPTGLGAIVRTWLAPDQAT